ncbi:hypothetical protein B7486_71745, partial [cyanobacterium TDX16]
MKTLALALLLCLPLGAVAQPPAPPAKTIDQLVTDLADARKQRADLDAKREDIDKQIARITADLKARLKELQDLLGPVAPKPPEPIPPPVPVDPIKAKLKTAFDIDGSLSKRDAAKDLAALYRQAAALSADPSVATAGELLQRVRSAAGTLIGP